MLMKNINDDDTHPLRTCKLAALALVEIYIWMMIIRMRTFVLRIMMVEGLIRKLVNVILTEWVNFSGL